MSLELQQLEPGQSTLGLAGGSEGQHQVLVAASRWAGWGTKAGSPHAPASPGQPLHEHFGGVNYSAEDNTVLNSAISW